VLDGIQKLSSWTEGVKPLWDEDTHADRQLHVVILGSAPLLMDHGLTESLAGRFETTRLAQWSLEEMESAVGAHLFHAARRGAFDLYYWRDGTREVDFVCESGKDLIAIEVKCERPKGASHGFEAFAKKYPGARPLLVGGDGIPLHDFLAGTRWQA
jgi:predicted AAA+ superfamily ATPase